MNGRPCSKDCSSLSARFAKILHLIEVSISASEESMKYRRGIYGLASRPLPKIGTVQKQRFTMKTRRGDVVLVLFPNSDLRTAKRRRALVLQRDDLGSGLNQTIVAMIFSNLARRGHPSRVPLMLNSHEGQQSGLRIDSVVMTDNVVTVLEGEVDSRLGELSDMAAVEKALKHTLGLA